MKVVGHHLQIEAKKRQGIERDQFARSAYNRYYYAAFLTVRSMLTGFDPKWAQMVHKDYPPLLTGQITRRYRSERTRARKNDDSELVEKLDEGVRAAAALAKLMKKAYATRVVADYQPSEPVKFSPTDGFSLMSIDITEAYNWESNIQTLVPAIKEAWKQINA